MVLESGTVYVKRRIRSSSRVSTTFDATPSNLPVFGDKKYDAADAGVIEA